MNKYNVNIEKIITKLFFPYNYFFSEMVLELEFQMARKIKLPFFSLLLSRKGLFIIYPSIKCAFMQDANFLVKAPPPGPSLTFTYCHREYCHIEWRYETTIQPCSLSGCISIISLPPLLRLIVSPDE